MVPAEFTEPQFFTYALGALIQLAAAMWVFSIAPGDPRHRSFAVLVTLNAVWDVVEGLYFASSPPRDDYYLRVYTHLAIWSAAALVWFLSLYPTRLARSNLVGSGALAAAVALSGWFAIDRSAAESPVFSLVSLLWTPLLTFGAFLALRTPLRRPQDPRSWSMILVAAAFLVYPLSQSITMVSSAYWTYLWGNLSDLGSARGAADAIVEAAYLVARIAALVLAILAIVAARKQPAGARRAAFVAALLGLVVAARLADLISLRFPAVNAVVFGVVITYALARARLFDVDLKLKLTVSRGAVVAAFTFVFILVSQTMQAFFEQEFGQDYLVAGLACGLLLLALNPLQRWAERFANRLLPDVKRTDSYEAQRKRDVYRNALAEAWEDGRITIKERRLLDAFARSLRLDAAEAARLEIDVVRSIGMPARSAQQA